tara:strand:+ start:367 stop:891 length:525 start_codon:yes stop_codon:yes gene_type:complete
MYSYYRNPKTTQEARASLGCPYVRAKRNKRNLPNAYDDIDISKPRKSWKSKRKTQYYLNQRGQKHEITFDLRRDYWKLYDYLDENNIPFCIKYLCETKTVYHRIYERKILRHELRYNREWMNGKWQNNEKHPIGYYPVYENVFTEKYQPYKWRRTIGYRITWWTDKDIGLEYIC